MSSPDERLNQMPPNYHNTYRKALQRKSMAAAVKSQCLECCGWQKEEVKLCTDLGCPLYKYRPFSRSRKSSKETDLAAQD